MVAPGIATPAQSIPLGAPSADWMTAARVTLTLPLTKPSTFTTPGPNCSAVASVRSGATVVPLDESFPHGATYTPQGGLTVALNDAPALALT
jgi:hypothetical protein